VRWATRHARIVSPLLWADHATLIVSMFKRTGIAVTMPSTRDDMGKKHHHD